jgi:phosphoenolpyruvate carboxykinase (ATP)
MQSIKNLEKLGLRNPGQIHYNLTPAELVEHTVQRGEGALADSGGLCVSTGEFTGRSPKDKFIVKDETTEDNVWWGDVNQPFAPEDFERLKAHLLSYLQHRELYIREAYAGADPEHRLKVRVINESPWQNLFVHNLFIRPDAKDLEHFDPDWTVIAAPNFYADPEVHNTRQHNFTILNFSQKLILIGGSAYTGEIKKGVFSVLNYVLPFRGVLPMHCSANVGDEDDVAVFFGLSGTGKTTLSADPERRLIGDDEHGWTQKGVFNFEGGCYAKCVDLSKEKEPQIWEAIRFQTLVENTTFYEGTRTVNFHDTSITPNTRAAYPLYYIPDAVIPSVGAIPQNIFMLTADAFGVLPPISKLTPGQAMYHFLSGYTAKVAGTEAGVKEPQATFSACFGLPFLPLHPTKYAEMLGKKMREHNVNVWLVNTGWTGGAFGVGHRIDLNYTRAMVSAALHGRLNSVEYSQDSVFGLFMPQQCPDVPDEILNPRQTWSDKAGYDEKANHLASIFNDNFRQYAEFADEEIKEAAPKILT